MNGIIQYVVLCDWLLSLSIMSMTVFLPYPRRIITEPALNRDVLRFKREAAYCPAQRKASTLMPLCRAGEGISSHPARPRTIPSPRARAPTRSHCVCALPAEGQRGARKAGERCRGAAAGMTGRASSWAPCGFSWERALQTVN